MAREWTKDETYHLIDLYKGLPSLWDVKSKDHRNRDKRSALLLNIAEEFSTTTEEVSRKIHNLRSQLSQEVRKARLRESDGVEDSFNIKWPFFDSLKFLIDINPSRLSRNVPRYFIVNQDPLQQTMDLYDESQDDEAASFGESEASTSNTSDLKRKDFGINLPAKRFCAPTTEVGNETPKVPEELDDDYSIFGKYVASEMRGFRHEDSVRRFKIGVQRMLLDILEEEYSQDQRQLPRGSK